MDHGDHWDAPLIDCDEALIDKVLTAVTNVHRLMIPGLFESMSFQQWAEFQEMQVQRGVTSQIS
jgi:hypothetical protein